MPQCSVPPNQPQALPTGQQAQDVPQCSVPPNQPQALPTGQQAQDVPQCSVPPNQPQALPTGQQAQDVQQCSVPPNQPQAKAQAPPTALQSAPSLQSSPLVCIMFLWQLDKVATVQMHNSYMGH